jgi:putative Holliday junction resolvase
MDGTESDFCARARKFARRLHGKFGVQVKMVDERLSTFEAKHQEHHRDTGKKHKGEINYRNQPVDDLAAVIILQTWLSDPTIAKEP